MEKRYENEEMEIDLLELFYVLRSKILAILMCGIIFGGLAFGYAKYLVTPQYTSSSMMLVLTKETTLSSLANLQIGSQLTKDYSLLITSRPVLTEVVDNLDLDMDYKALKNCITVTNQDDTRILQIAVQYPDAKKAKDIVDELSNVASEYIGEQMEVTPPEDHRDRRSVDSPFGYECDEDNSYGYPAWHAPLCRRGGSKSIDG